MLEGAQPGSTRATLTMEPPFPPSPPAPTGIRRTLAMPEVPRVLPFVLFLGVGALQGQLFPGSEYWLYAVKTLLVGGVLWSLREYLPEMKWSFSGEALGVGVAIAALWIGLDGLVPSLNELWHHGTSLVTGKPAEPAVPEPSWNPLAYFAATPVLGWAFVIIRVLGRSLVVPAVEEVFYRSFFHRTLAGPKFYELPLGLWHPTAFVVTSVVFGLAHPGQWLPATICGAAYQLLVVRKKRLGDAMVAHATTNLIISGYAIATGQWQFT